MSSEPNLDERTDKEEKSSNDGDSEADLVKSASSSEAGSVVHVRVGASNSIAERALDVVSCALPDTIAGQYCDGYKGGAEQDVQENSQECEKRLSAQTAGQDDGEDGVDDTNTRHALNSLLPLWYGDMVSGLD